MKTHINLHSTIANTSWFQRGAAALAALLVGAVLGIALVSALNRGAQPAPSGRVAAARQSSGPEQYEDFKLRQSDLVQARGANIGTPALWLARARYWIFKLRQAEQMASVPAARIDAGLAAARERYTTFKLQQAEWTTAAPAAGIEAGLAAAQERFDEFKHRQVDQIAARSR